MPDSIKRLTDLFAKFPTVGPRTAGRFVFYLINQPKQEVENLISAIQELKTSIALCDFCFNPHQSQQKLCPICQDNGRNRQMLCIVEKETDLLSIEATKRYKGLYFILGSNSLTLRKVANNELRIDDLKKHMENPEKFGLPKHDITEIIIATNPTPEGKAASLAVEKILKELPSFAAIKITHLAKGLPVGGELEYADEETLESAFEGRK